MLRGDLSEYQESAIQAAETVLKKRGYEAAKLEAYKEEIPVEKDHQKEKYQRVVYVLFGILLLLVALFRLVLFVEKGQVWQMFGFLLLLVGGITYAVHKHLRPLL